MTAGSTPALGTKGSKETRLGRQLADHPRLERRMLRVRLPPEPLTKHMSSWSSQECSPRCQRGDRGFKSRRGRFVRTARYANRKSGEAQTFVILRVRLPPLPLETCVGWALACPSGCNPPVSDIAGSTPARRSEGRKIIWLVRLSVQDSSLSRCKGGFNSRTGHSEQLTKWCNW